MFTESAKFYDAIYSFKDYTTEAAQIAVRVRSVWPGAHSVLAADSRWTPWPQSRD